MTRTTLYGATHAGPLVDDARQWRVRAGSDGSLVVHEPGGTERVVASPGQVARVVLVPAAQLGRRLLGLGSRKLASSDVVSFLGDDTVLLTIPLSQIRLGSMEGDPRATSGASDVALTLGLALEPATDEEVRLVNSAPGALTRGTRTDALRTRLRWHLAAFVWLVAGYVAVIVLGRDTENESVVVIVLAMTPAAVFLGIEAWRRSSTFFAQTPTPPDARVVVPNVAGPDRWRWLRESQLQIGRDDIVHVRHVQETWLPGPVRGGVVRCAVSDDAIWFFDRHDVFLSVLPAELWVPAGEEPHAIRDACTQAGITFTRHEGLDLPPFVAADLAPEVYASTQALTYTIRSHFERGALFLGAGWLTTFFALLGLIFGLGSLSLYDPSTPVAIALAVSGVLNLAVLGFMVAMYIRAKRWDRRQMETLT